MARTVKSPKPKQMTQKTINNIMRHSPPHTEQPVQQPVITKHYEHGEYDLLNAEAALKAFLDFSRELAPKYHAAVANNDELDKETQDILHFMELEGDMNAAKGYKAYRALAEVRRQRRLCKNEIELMEPLVNFVETNQSFFKQMEGLLGRIRIIKQAISNRSYAMRTGAVQSIIDSPTTNKTES